jgi:hypothetical protein
VISIESPGHSDYLTCFPATQATLYSKPNKEYFDFKEHKHRAHGLYNGESIRIVSCS